MDRIYLFTSPHPLHETLVTNPPEGYDFVSNTAPIDFEIIKAYDTKQKFLKNFATNLYNLLNQPRIIYISRNCDLIHTCGGIIPLNMKPWVVSIETGSSFLGYQEEKINNSILRRKIIKHLSSKNCKKILPFSIACKNSLLNTFFNDDIADFLAKIEVLYPAIMSFENMKKSKDNVIRLLHVGNQFFDKGGRELVKAFEMLSKKYDVELYMIVDAPKHHHDIFYDFINKYKKLKGLHIITQKISRDMLFNNYYLNCDIFVLPSYIDTFGYVFLEAMSTGLPVIGTDIFAIPEIIDNGVNGFLVHSPISPFNSSFVRTTQSLVSYRSSITKEQELSCVVKDLYEKISVLIENDALRRKMGQESFKMVESGKFSVKERNKQLKNIYDCALK